VLIMPNITIAMSPDLLAHYTECARLLERTRTSVILHVLEHGTLPESAKYYALFAPPKADASPESQAATREAKAEARLAEQREYRAGVQARRDAHAEAQARREAEAQARREARAEARAKSEAEAQARREARASVETKAQRSARLAAEYEAKRIAHNAATDARLAAHYAKVEAQEARDAQEVRDRGPDPELEAFFNKMFE
jgi:hypothetical protein